MGEGGGKRERCRKGEMGQVEEEEESKMTTCERVKSDTLRENNRERKRERERETDIKRSTSKRECQCLHPGQRVVSFHFIRNNLHTSV